jgi:glycosyltransferase involved in cell wall biosynthesis
MINPALPDPYLDRGMVAAFAETRASIGMFEQAKQIPNRTLTPPALRRAARPMRAVMQRGRTEADWWRSRRDGADLAVFHEFHEPPYGGGNQFLLALVGELEGRGLTVEVNRLSGATPACLFNSFNFDFSRLRRFARAGARMVHRVDGPIGVYRGFDDGTDARIFRINAQLADATVFQSHWSLDRHRELGVELREPVVIHNTVDPAIFHPPARRGPLDGPLRVVATSWSSNPRKGSDILRRLDREHDPARIRVTFVGNSDVAFERIRAVAAVPSRALADILRTNDVYLATSRDDPCSNALLEGLACGLPAAYLRSGGHSELVGEGGIGYDDASQLTGVFERLRVELEERRAAIRVPALTDVADRYLDVLNG